MDEDRWGADLSVAVGLGCNTFGRTTDDAASRRVLDAFAEAGGALVDTAGDLLDGRSSHDIDGLASDSMRMVRCTGERQPHQAAGRRSLR